MIKTASSKKKLAIAALTISSIIIGSGAVVIYLNYMDGDIESSWHRLLMCSLLLYSIGAIIHHKTSYQFIGTLLQCASISAFICMNISLIIYFHYNKTWYDEECKKQSEMWFYSLKVQLREEMSKEFEKHREEVRMSIINEYRLTPSGNRDELD